MTSANPVLAVDPDVLTAGECSDAQPRRRSVVLAAVLGLTMLGACAAPPAAGDLPPSGWAALTLTTDDYAESRDGIAYCIDGPSEFSGVTFGNVGALGGEEIGGSIEISDTALGDAKWLVIEGPYLEPSPLPTPAGDGVPVGWGSLFASWEGPAQVISLDADHLAGRLRFERLPLVMTSLDSTYPPPAAGDRPAFLTGEIRWSCE